MAHSIRLAVNFNDFVSDMSRYLFNDAEVKTFDPAGLATECFGGEMTVSLV